MYEILGGKPALEQHPFEVPLINFTLSLDKIMKFGDDQRAAGRAPCVVIPSETLGGTLGQGWIDHEDNSGILDNIPAHIDAFIVDYVSAETPKLPEVWTGNGGAWLFWEYAPGKVKYNGTYDEFVNMFGYDPEVVLPPDPDSDLSTEVGEEVHIVGNFGVFGQMDFWIESVK